MKEQGLSYFQRPMEHVSRTGERAKTDGDLAERGQRHRQAVSGRILFVQRYAAFGQLQRLLVAMADHRDVGLIAARDRDHVVGADGSGEPFGLSEGGERLVVAVAPGSLSWTQGS